jgi:acetyl esterase/lipase
MKNVFCFFCFLLTLTAPSQTLIDFTQQEVIYGRRDGMGLTMTVLKPAKPNGKGIISLISGNWVSTKAWDDLMIDRAKPFLQNGYTVFLTMHCSAPKYSIPDAVEDVKRAIQYVRYNASSYGIDSAHVGITGTSSGGHLALTAATADEIKDPNAKDPIERVSSKVQAVAVFCPPTDFLNFGKLGFNPTGQKELLQQLDVLGAFTYTTWDSIKRVYVPIVDETKILEITKQISPAEMATSDDAPAYIMHGDKDVNVPLQQSQLMEEKLKAVKVPVTLTVKVGAGHGWKGMNEDEKEFIKWFDKYLMVKY